MAKLLVVSAWKCGECSQTYIYWKKEDIPKATQKINKHINSHGNNIQGTFHTFFVSLNSKQNEIPPAGRFGGDQALSRGKSDGKLFTISLYYILQGDARLWQEKRKANRQANIPKLITHKGYHAVPK